MKNGKKVVAVLLTAAFCGSLFLQASASISATTAALFENDKISASLAQKLQESKREPVSTMVWLPDIDMERVESAALEACASDTRAATGTVLQNSDKLDIDVQTYVETKRSVAAETYKRQNEELAKSLFDSNDIIFISSYSPMVLASLDTAEVLDIAGSDAVVALDYYEGAVVDDAEDNEQISVDLSQRGIDRPLAEINGITRATDVHESAAFGFTGENVIIGLFETNLPTESLFADLDLVLHEEGSVGGHTDHADAVLKIVSSIAPDAKYYVTSCGSAVSDYTIFSRIEWLLSQNVNVINASRALSDQADTYDAMAMWIDHIAYQHDVHFVVAPGNAACEIDAGAMAYNAVTVGNMNVGSRATPIEQYEISDSSGRYLYDIYAYKPDLCAPGERFIISELDDYLCEGTSYAAPHVTGLVALLCDQNEYLKIAQNTVKAILTASVNFSSPHRFVPTDEDYRSYGAGLIDCLGACWVAGNYRYITTTYPAGTSQKQHTFTVTSSDTLIRVSLAWNIRSVASGSGHNVISGSDITDLNLEVKDPNGNTVGYSSTTQNNVEIVQFVPTMTGTYTIIVTRADTASETTYYGLAWR